MYARRFGVRIKAFYAFGMGEIENTGRKVFVTVLCYIEDLMLQMLIFNGHDVAGDKRVILDVI